jgi:hypothetical protein
MAPATIKEISALLDEKLEKKLNEKLKPINEFIKCGYRREMDEAKMEISRLSMENNELQQYTRKNNLIITGIPKLTAGENTVELVLNFAKAINYQLSERDLDATHRLRQRNKESDPPIIVKFVSRIVRTKFLIHCREKRPTANIMGGQPNVKVFVNEHLTPQTADLLKYAKLKLVKKQGPRNTIVTTRDCKVVARRENGNWIRLVNYEHIDRIAAENAVNESTQSTPMEIQNEVQHRTTNKPNQSNILTVNASQNGTPHLKTRSTTAKGTSSVAHQTPR